MLHDYQLVENYNTERKNQLRRKKQKILLSRFVLCLHCVDNIITLQKLQFYFEK
jgi:hypothetical protein